MIQTPGTQTARDAPPKFGSEIARNSPCRISIYGENDRVSDVGLPAAAGDAFDPKYNDIPGKNEPTEGTDENGCRTTGPLAESDEMLNPELLMDRPAAGSLQEEIFNVYSSSGINETDGDKTS